MEEEEEEEGRGVCVVCEEKRKEEEEEEEEEGRGVCVVCEEKRKEEECAQLRLWGGVFPFPDQPEWRRSPLSCCRRSWRWWGVAHPLSSASRCLALCPASLCLVFSSLSDTLLCSSYVMAREGRRGEESGASPALQLHDIEGGRRREGGRMREKEGGWWRRGKEGGGRVRERMGGREKREGGRAA